MKSASIRDVQHNLSEVLAWVERGEQVAIYRRRKMVAKLVPPTPGPVVSPDFVGRAREVWGKKPQGTPLGELVDQDRQER